MHAQISYLEEKYDAKIHLINMPEIDLSSNFIRNRVHENETIRFFVPEKVRQYIYENHLYKGL